MKGGENHLEDKELSTKTKEAGVWSVFHVWIYKAKPLWVSNITDRLNRKLL